MFTVFDRPDAGILFEFSSLFQIYPVCKMGMSPAPSPVHISPLTLYGYYSVNFP